jgi:tetratricopeptide (TPR) repeat protein
MLAQFLFAANQPALARAELERVVKSQPTDPEPYQLFGEVAFQQRQYTEADLLFAKSLELSEQLAANPRRQQNLTKRANFGLASVAEVREDWQTAQKYLKAISQAEPADIAAGTRLARTMFQLGDDKGAYNLLGQIWKKDEKTTRPEVTMGVWYEQSGKRANASNLMKKVAERDAKGLETQLAVARWALDAGELDLAKSCADRALELEPNSLEAKLVLGLVARYNKDYAAARSAYESAHLQSPSHLAAMLQLSLVLLEQTGNERMALDYAQTAARIFSDLSQATGREAAVTLAWVLLRLGRPAEAQRAIQEALAAGSVSPEGAYFAARILEQGGNTEAAGKLLQTALNNDPSFPTRTDADRLLKQLMN